MPVFIAALVGGLVSAAGSFVGRVVIALGVTVLTFSGIDLALTGARDSAIANLQSLPAVTVQLLGLMKVGTGLNIIFSACSARLVIAGLSSGVVRRWGTR